MSGGQVGCRRVEMKIGLLSDAHGNREALERAFEVLEQAKAARVYFMGDAIGYLPGVAALESLAGPECSVPAGGTMKTCFLPATGPSSAMNTISSRRHGPSCHRNCSAQSSRGRPVAASNSRSGLRSCVTGARIVMCTVMSMRIPTWPGSMSLRVRPSSWAITHRPFIRRHAGVTYVNVGSCGMPRDRGDLGAVCLFDIQSGSVRIIRFDIAQQNAAAIRRCGDVSQAVAEVFARRSSNVCFGELHEG